MRRNVLLATAAAVMVATVALSGTAFADPAPPDNPPIDSGNPSCFGAYARSEPGPPGPGTTVVKPIVTVVAPQGVDELARFVGLVNQTRPCPPEQS